MFYVTLKNRAGHVFRVFAVEVERAKEIAVSAGRARKVENLRVVTYQAVDPDLFPYEGMAALRLAPAPRVWIASLCVEAPNTKRAKWQRYEQLTGDLR
jgi:hypothetical protein